MYLICYFLTDILVWKLKIFSSYILILACTGNDQLKSPVGITIHTGTVYVVENNSSVLCCEATLLDQVI